MRATTPAIEMLPVTALKPYPRSARRHTKKQVRQICDSIRRFGFTNPVLISDEMEIIAGHGRVMAAKELGIASVPTVKLSHLSAEDRRAYVLADELQALIDIEFDTSLTGFSLVEIDLTLDQAKRASPDTPERDVADRQFAPPANPVSRLGDLCLGRHRLLCGDAQASRSLDLLLGGEKVDRIFTDPPYNVRIDGYICDLGTTHHREFAYASGEMTGPEFTQFLTTTLSHAAAVSCDGAIAFVCMDWRHMRELLDAGESAFSELKNLCVWDKTNGGMGSFYRSKHELIFVFKIGEATHTNTFGLGDTGRYRTNVWDYPGISSLGAHRAEELAMHPTVKPVALVADAIKDCSRRGEIVLDVFGGSGTTLIAAETCGRQARLIEVDTGYCDTIIARWQAYTGKAATLADKGMAFEDVALERMGMSPDAASAAVLTKGH